MTQTMYAHVNKRIKKKECVGLHLESTPGIWDNYFSQDLELKLHLLSCDVIFLGFGG
jgi:hypothetical protein